MKQLKAIHDLFLFEDDLFRNEAEIFRNKPCTGIRQNREQGVWGIRLVEFSSVSKRVETWAGEYRLNYLRVLLSSVNGTCTLAKLDFTPFSNCGNLYKSTYSLLLRLYFIAATTVLSIWYRSEEDEEDSVYSNYEEKKLYIYEKEGTKWYNTRVLLLYTQELA